MSVNVFHLVGVGGDDQSVGNDEQCGFHYGDLKGGARREIC